MGFISSGEGKFPTEYLSKQIIINDFKNYIPRLFELSYFQNVDSLDPGWVDYITNTPNISSQYGNLLIATLPGQRYSYYADANFNKIKKNVLGELSKLDRALGFYNVASNPHLLQQLEPYSYVVMFIGLIFDVLMIIFVVVSILLIYSLLIISVETKMFEIGVMRLVGLTKLGFTGMILTQAVMFVLPAVILGFAVAIPLIYFLYSVLFESSLGYMPSVLPTLGATLRAVFIGLLIPLLSSIVPIRRVLSSDLTEALNTQRSKSQGVLIEVVDMKAKKVIPYLLFGSLAVIFGIIIYYGLPLAMLLLNFGLILTIFFMILMGLLLGLVLFSVNLQSALEHALLHILLFWEKKSIKILVAQNIMAHKKKNQLTAIIYALTLGCIIFLLTSATLQIETINAFDTIDGADIVVSG